MATKGLLNARKFEGLTRGVSLHAKMLGACRLVLVRGMTPTEAGRAVGASRQAVQQACDRLLNHAGRCPVCSRPWPTSIAEAVEGVTA